MFPVYGIIYDVTYIMPSILQLFLYFQSKQTTLAKSKFNWMQFKSNKLKWQNSVINHYSKTLEKPSLDELLRMRKVDIST
jgi:hypothetical protein